MYKAIIIRASRELSIPDKIRLKDVSNAFKLDQAISNDGSLFTLAISDWAILDVHNDSATNKDYKKLVMQTPTGEKYATSSEVAIRTLIDIWEELGEYVETQEAIVIDFFKRDSKGYPGSHVIMCSLSSVSYTPVVEEVVPF